MSFSLDGYVTVAERIDQLKAKYPEAVLRPYDPKEPFKVMEIGGREFIVYTAACYRTPDDPMPAVAVAAEPAVGSTSFTKNSEVMNAESSAWGRAIMAALACDTTKVASLDEVRNRRAEQSRDTTNHPSQGGYKPQPKPQGDNVTAIRPGGGLISQKQIGLIGKLTREKNLNNDDLMAVIKRVIGRDLGGKLGEATSKEASAIITELMTPSAPVMPLPQDEEPF
jgi:hypothetical protein